MGKWVRVKREASNINQLEYKQRCQVVNIFMMDADKNSELITSSFLNNINNWRN